MIGLCGAHRTGKTTLAKAYAERAGIPYIQTNVASTYERLGLSAKQDYDFGTRLMIQGEILKDCSALYESAGIQWISDRTPLDFVMYTLADVQRQNVSNADAYRLDQYIEDCFDLTNRHFTTVIAIQPGIPLIEAEGKAPANSAYMEHLNAIIMGLLVSSKLQCAHYYLPSEMTDLERRIVSVGKAVAKSAMKHKEAMQSMYSQGISLHYSFELDIMDK